MKIVNNFIETPCDFPDNGFDWMQSKIQPHEYVY